MVKRYYCDYCDKSFPYSVEGRKKHRTGYHHLQQLKAHYDTFRTACEKLDDEHQREKCRIFHSGGSCWFGDACKYSHLTPAGLDELQQNALEEEECKKLANLPTQVKGDSEPTLEAWLAARNKSPTTTTTNVEDLAVLWQTTPEASASLHSILPSLLPSLPPSLTPPDPATWTISHCPDWG